MNLLVIGYGNELRGDDAVGPCVARAVGEQSLPGITTLVAHGLTPELAEPISGADAVVFVDACVESEAVELVELHPGPAPKLGHGSDPGWLLSLAESLSGHRPTAWMLKVPVTEMGFGEGLSQRARDGMALAVEWIGALSPRRN